MSSKNWWMRFVTLGSDALCTTYLTFLILITMMTKLPAMRKRLMQQICVLRICPWK